MRDWRLIGDNNVNFDFEEIEGGKLRLKQISVDDNPPVPMDRVFESWDAAVEGAVEIAKQVLG